MEGGGDERILFSGQNTAFGFKLDWIYHLWIFVGFPFSLKMKQRGFPGGAVVKNLPANAEDTGLIPGPGRPHMPRSN